MEFLVLKITGKAFTTSDLLVKYAKVIRDISKTHRVVVVTGGGEVARKYIELAREVGVTSNYWLDEIGIWVSRLNALILIGALSPLASPTPPRTLEEIVRSALVYPVTVTGGLIPGQSTASVLLQAAEALGVKRVYYFSAIGKVYTKDPTKHPDAKPLSELSASELKKIVEQKALPGDYALIDSQALEYAIRSGVEIQVLDYKNPELMFEAMRGKNPGSRILPK
ncbi:MAG: UMP kinase [Desulfurococcaceae archaeon]|nr:UMP kinase [Desulfurococcaceae archaeon]